MSDGKPLLRVVRGEPDDAELAALTAVVLGVAGSRSAVAGPEPVARSQWAGRAVLVRRALSVGPGAWRASGLPS
ncbi:MAG TPA: acyl-CoA carboxylase subunit epsilon [Pseudonocardiaceae bacterium]